MNTAELTHRVAGLIHCSLESGAAPSEVAFALVSLAADMGLQLGGDPRQVLALLLSAIARQANQHCESEGACIQGAPIDATIN